MSHAQVVYGCGCTSTVAIPDGVERAVIRMVEPGENKRVYSLEVVRLSTTPPVFVEGNNPRPDWARTCHVMVAFDVRAFELANWKDFEMLFGPYRKAFGPMVPQCWLPDMLNGNGRFYGLWKWQKPLKGRAVGHLQLIELDSEGEEEEEEIGPEDETDPDETSD